MSFTIKLRGSILYRAYKPYITADHKVLDVGCGNGVMAQEIRQYFKCDITGCDIMDYIKLNIPFKFMPQGDQIPFEDNTFDIVMLNDMLHHTPFDNQTNLILGALKVTRSKVLIFETAPTRIAKFLDIVINKFHNADMPMTLTMRNFEGWGEFFKKHGIKYEAKKLEGPFPFYPFSNYVFALYK